MVTEVIHYDILRYGCIVQPLYHAIPYLMSATDISKYNSISLYKIDFNVATP